MIRSIINWVTSVLNKMFFDKKKPAPVVVQIKDTPPIITQIEPISKFESIKFRRSYVPYMHSNRMLKGKPESVQVIQISCIATHPWKMKETHIIYVKQRDTIYFYFESPYYEYNPSKDSLHLIQKMICQALYDV